MTLAALRALMARLPFNSHIGLKVKRLHRDGVTIECPIRDHYGNMHGTLHGGVTATLVDVAAGFSVLAFAGRPATTVELKLNYFVPISGDFCTARGHILRQGNTLSVCRVDVFTHTGKLAGTALVTFMLVDGKL
jgi:uncharacterized protein (TIGR00369 family)